MAWVACAMLGRPRMLHILVEPPRNAGYMWAGYIVGLGILLSYTAWLLLRVKNAVDGKR